MITEKSIITSNLLEQLQKHAGKVGFMPDDEIVDAIRLLEDKGIPNNKHEDYKYCNIESVLRKEFKTVEQSFDELTHNDIAPLKLDEAINVVVVNGNYQVDLSEKMVVKRFNILPLNDLFPAEKKRLASLAKSKTDALIALNSTFTGNGFFLEIEKEAVLPMPIHIIYINSSKQNSVVNTRNFIHVRENAEVTIVESFYNIGAGKVFSNVVSEKLIDENAKLTSYTIQTENELSYAVHTNQVSVNKYANYTNTTLTLSGELVRNNHNVELVGENCEANLNGLFITNGNQLVDNHTLIDHQVPNCQSNELYKGIAKGKSTGVFNGKIFVRKDAQKTNAYQSSKNILLSDDATINTKPQLEIYADDVKCSHGTSTGKIDEDALYYLKARGIGDDNARKLLLQAFAQELIDKIEIESLKEKVLHLFEKAL
ncbi:MAG: Fe-S cluster assembly protein SufD [Bacteroidia bacterium]|nr:Fe-S cluster assembly protein SufD [Bacteroidia bacterium]